MSDIEERSRGAASARLCRSRPEPRIVACLADRASAIPLAGPP